MIKSDMQGISQAPVETEIDPQKKKVFDIKFPKFLASTQLQPNFWLSILKFCDPSVLLPDPDAGLFFFLVKQIY